ncbi:MAG TPA: metal-dependent hydrolase [Candidatus Didemnitutus sp.]|nr:metal-dependent hydrolase [Candidatus Didemnitutus sp.]
MAGHRRIGEGIRPDPVLVSLRGAASRHRVVDSRIGGARVAEMRVTFYGHSCFLLEAAGARVLIDPFLTGNQQASIAAEDVRCDTILLSHGHEDHTCDALEIARRNNALIVGNYEIAEYFAAKGARTHGLNPGGGFRFPFGRVSLTLAQHTSSLGDPLNPVYMGVACGLLISAEGRKVYHAGDTALFLDMQLIGRAGLDLAMIPIGDNFTMGPDDALESLGLLQPKIAVPMHYNTWPVIAQDVDEFARRAAARGHHVEVLPPGGILELSPIAP